MSLGGTMKRLTAVVIAGALLVACGSDGSSDASEDDILKGRAPNVSVKPIGGVNPAGALPALAGGVVAAPAEPPIPNASSTPNPPVPTKANEEFLFLAFGDSYGSGEGNPLVMGNYPDGKKVTVAEQWAGAIANGAIAASGDERCHRSDASGSAKAAALVKAQYPQLKVVHKSFACSGAVSKNITTTPYKGADQKVFNGKTDLPAQIEQAKAAVKPEEVDAIYVSIGGNDAQFAGVVAECFVAAPIFQNTCSKADNTEVNTALGLIETVDDAIVSVATALRNTFNNAYVIFSAYPDPLSVDPSDDGDVDGDGICSEEDRESGVRFEDDYMWYIDPAAAKLLRDRFLANLNATIKTGVDTANKAVGGVSFVDEHYVGRSGNAGFCSRDNTPIVRFNNEIKYLQGIDDDAGKSGIEISKGAWHPSDAGYELYASSIFNGLVASGAIASRSAPNDPSVPWATSITSAGKYTIAWSDLSDNETSFEISYTSGGTTKSASVGPGQTTFSFDGGSATSVYVVAVRACGTKGLVQTPCSNWKSTTVSNALPVDKPGSVSCTSSKYGQFVDSACNVSFSIPQRPTQTSAMFSYVEIKNGNTVVGSALTPVGGGQVKIKYLGEKEGTKAKLSATAFICTIVDGGRCLAGPSSTIELTVEKPDSRKLLPPPSLSVRPNVNIPKLPGVPAPAVTPPGLQASLQCSAGKCGP